MSSQPPAQLRQASLPYSNTTHPSLSYPSCPGSPIPISCLSEGSLTAGDRAPRWTGRRLSNRRRRQVISLDSLPDDALLEILDFCADEDQLTKRGIEAWQSLVHVCRRWRGLVFGSPRRLNLRLVCTTETPARDTLDVWPSFPLIVRVRACRRTKGVDNIVAVLERSHRVEKIELFDVSQLPLKILLAAMQGPFPKLTHLELCSYDESVPVLSDSFLGGSASLLREFLLDGIPFPGLPKLLFSATHLVTLHLLDIPHSGYISPEAMLTALFTLTSLESFWLEFRSPRSRPDQPIRRLPPRAHSILPVITTFWFKGVSEYLEVLVARIDAPGLNNLYITFFNQIVFDTPQLIQFVNRTPRLKPLEKARVSFEDGAARINLLSQTYGYGELNVKIPCRQLDWQVSSLEQVCTLSLPPLSTLEGLYIYQAPYSRPDWQDNVENTLWLRLLHPFSTVKNLYLSEEFAPRIVPALEELVGGRTTEVLPTLQNIFLEGIQTSGPVREGIEKFVAARQVTSHFIAVSRWGNSKQDKV